MTVDTFNEIIATASAYVTLIGGALVWFGSVAILLAIASKYLQKFYNGA